MRTGPLPITPDGRAPVTPIAPKPKPAHSTRPLSGILVDALNASTAMHKTDALAHRKAQLTTLAIKNNLVSANTGLPFAIGVLSLFAIHNNSKGVEAWLNTNKASPEDLESALRTSVSLNRKEITERLIQKLDIPTLAKCIGTSFVFPFFGSQARNSMVEGLFTKCRKSKILSRLESIHLVILLRSNSITSDHRKYIIDKVTSGDSQWQASFAEEFVYFLAQNKHDLAQQILAKFENSLASGDLSTRQSGAFNLIAGLKHTHYKRTPLFFAWLRKDEALRSQINQL